MEHRRPIEWRRHDDGVNAWAFAAAPAARALAGIVTGYAAYTERTGAFTTRRELPASQAVLIINLGAPIGLVGGDGTPLNLKAGEGFVAGFHSRPALSISSGAQAGIHAFMPLAGLHALLGADMDGLADRVIDLAGIFGPAAAALGQALGNAPDEPTRFDLLDAALIARLHASRPAPTRSDRAVDWAAARLAAEPATSIAALAADIGCSRKHLAAGFRRRIGSGPRHFARLIRFERVVAALTPGRPPAWADLAAACGYSDQSHLIRDIRDFAGLTPSALAARQMPDGGGFVET